MSQNKTITVAIKATDGASQTFLAVGRNAQTAAVAIEGTGASSRAAAADFDRLEKRAVAAGVALGTVVGAVSRLGAANEDQRRQIDGIERAYGSASRQVLAYAESVQDSTRFSNDAARASLQTTATLVRGYSLTTAQVEQLISRSADLAQIKGIDLPAAVERTTAAIRGEAESAEYLGITLNDNFVAAEAARRGMDGWTTTMTEAEKAQFRLTLLMEQTTYAQGAAGDAAETAAGQTAQLTNEFQDLIANAGGVLGPIGGATSSLAELAIILPVVGAGIGKVVTWFPKLAGGATLAGGALGTGSGGLAAAAAAAGPLLGALGGAAVVAAPAILAVAAAVHQADEAQRRWNESQAAGTTWLEQNKTAAGDIDPVLRDIAAAFENTAAIVTVTMGDTTVGLEDVAKMLWELDETSTKALGHMARNMGTLDPTEIEQIAKEVVRLTEVERKYEEEAYTKMELDRAQAEVVRGLDDATIQWADTLNMVNQALARPANSQFWQGIWDDARQTREETQKVEDAIRAIDANLDAGGVISFPTVGDPDVVAAAQIDYEGHERRREERIAGEEEAQREYERITRERLSLNEQLENAEERRADAVERANEIEQDAIERTRDIQRAYVQDQKAAEKELSQSQRSLAGERVDIERETQKELRDLEQQRRDVAIETEEQLRDLAAQRADIQTGVTRDLADAEREYHDSIAETAREQRELRADMATARREAAADFQAAARDNARSLRELKEELRDTLADNRLDRSRDYEDLNLRGSRAVEDANLALSDLAKETLTPEERAKREADIALDLKRTLEDIALDRQRIEEDFAADQAQAREDARDQEKALDRDRKADKAAYHTEVRGLEKDTSDKIKALMSDQNAAAKAFAGEQKTIKDQAARDLADLSGQYTTVLDDQKTKFSEIEGDKRIILRDSAIEQRILARDSAQIEAGYRRDLNVIERGYQRDLQIAAGISADAAKDASEAIGDIDEDIGEIRGELGKLDGTTVAIDADTAPLTSKVGDAQTAVTTLTEATHTTEIDASTASFDGAILDATRDGEAFAAKVFTAKLAGDYTGGTEGGGAATAGSNDMSFFDAHQAAVELGVGFSKITYTAKLDGSTVDVGEAILSADRELKEWAMTDYVAQVDVERSATFARDKADIGNDLLDFANYPITQEIRVAKDDQWTLIFNQVKREIEADIKSINATVRVTVAQAAPATTPPPPSGQGTRPNRAGGGIGAGQYAMVGEFGPEKVWLPNGSYVWNAGATQGSLASWDGARFAGGGQVQAQGGQGFNTIWRKWLKKQPVELQRWLTQVAGLTSGQKHELVAGTLEVKGTGPDTWRIGNAGSADGGGGGGQQPRVPEPTGPAPQPQVPLPTTPPAIAPPPPPLGVDTNPLPLPAGTVAGDIPLYGANQAFAGQIARMAVQGVGAFGGGATSLESEQIARQLGGTRSQSSSTPDGVIGQLARNVQALQRSVEMLARQMAEMERNTSTPLANYGTLYLQSGGDLSVTEDAARQAATALRV